MAILNTTITVNEEKFLFKVSFTLCSLLKYLGFKTDLIVVDYNGNIIQKEYWHLIELKANDRIEILTIAGGG